MSDSKHSSQKQQQLHGRQSKKDRGSLAQIPASPHPSSSSSSSSTLSPFSATTAASSSSPSPSSSVDPTPSSSLATSPDAVLVPATAADDDDEDREEAVKDKVAEWIFWWLLDDVVLGFAFDIHRLCATGMWHAIEGVPEDDAHEHQVVDDPGLDIFGHPLGQSKSVETVCPQCKRSIQACRFAPHLEKCMGMGRHSSRVASRRITSVCRDLASSETAGLGLTNGGRHGGSSSSSFSAADAASGNGKTDGDDGGGGGACGDDDDDGEKSDPDDPTHWNFKKEAWGRHCGGGGGGGVNGRAPGRGKKKAAAATNGPTPSTTPATPRRAKKAKKSSASSAAGKSKARKLAAAAAAAAAAALVREEVGAEQVASFRGSLADFASFNSATKSAVLDKICGAVDTPDSLCVSSFDCMKHSPQDRLESRMLYN